MFIVSATPLTPIRDKQIDAPIQKLWIDVAFNEIGNMIENPYPGSYLQFLLNTIKISVQKQTSNGNIPILLPIGLGSIAEISSANESHLNVRTYPTRVSIELTVDLSANNAIKSGDGQFLLLTIDTSNAVSSLNGGLGTMTSLEVYGVEYPIVGNSFTSYKQLKVNANTQKTISLVGKDVLSLPRLGFKQLDLVFPDRTVTYQNDIKAITQALENLVMNYVFIDETNVSPRVFTQTYYDGVLMHTIGVASVIECKVLYDVDTTIITTEQSNIQ